MKIIIINLSDVSGDYVYVMFKNLNGSVSYSSVIYLKKIEIDFTKFIKEITFEIDEYIIEKHTTDWLLAYNHYFNRSESSNKIINNMKNITPSLFNKDIQIYLPLRFFFTKESQSALPIASLYHSSIFIKMYTNSKLKIFDYMSDLVSNVNINSCLIATNFVYLDTNEKMAFLKSTHNLLIEQVQEQNDLIITNSTRFIELGFTKLCKYLIWNLPYQYILNSARLTFNNSDLFSAMDGEYFNLVQPLQYNLGNSNSFTRMEYNKNLNGTYYLYSFCLFPSSRQPSGLCNMSRIDDIFLYYNVSHVNSGITDNHEINMNIYCVNYNFLVIKGGKCKLQF